MKIAFVHDRIIEQWWAEKVLKDWIKDYIKKYPNAEFKIFTVFWKKNHRQFEIQSQTIWNTIADNNNFSQTLSENFLRLSEYKIPVEYVLPVNENHKIPFFSIDYRNLMPFFPILWKFLSKKIKKFNPDIIFISSFAIAKNIKIPQSTKEVTYYLHSPMQYIWEMYDEYLNKFWFFKKQIYKIVAKYLQHRCWKYNTYIKNLYLKNSTPVLNIYYNSFYTKKCFKKYFWRNFWKVKYPKIDDVFIKHPIPYKILDYFVFVWRVVKFAKELDKIIELFNKTGDNLLIIWDWPDKTQLQKKAKSNIIFLWKIENKKTLAKIVSQSRWLINLTKESFGLATAEALAMWVPVFAYWEGGSYELLTHQSQTIWNSITDNNRSTSGNFPDKSSDKSLLLSPYGVLIFNKSPETILKWFEIFKNTNFDRKTIKENFVNFLNNTFE